MMPRIAKAILILAVMLASSPSHAVVYDLGLLAHGENYSGTHNVSGQFEDTFRFTVLSRGDADVGAGALNFTLRGFPFLNVDGFSVSLFNASHALIGGGSGDTVDFSVRSLTAGDYYLTLAGVANGSQGGTYASAISFAAVPEPDAWILLLAGMAMVGYMSIRRPSA